MGKDARTPRDAAPGTGAGAESGPAHGANAERGVGGTGTATADETRAAAPAAGGAAELDARGLLCPLPVLKAAKRMRALPGGARLAMLADDPAAVIDVPHFCNEQGYRLVEAREAEGGATLYIIEKPA